MRDLELAEARVERMERKMWEKRVLRGWMRGFGGL